MKTVKARCHVCGSQHTFTNQTLDDVRAKECERCKVRLTVISSEGQMTAPPMPDCERRVLTTKETNDARRLLVEALGEKA
jgi:hypothetical protein